MGVLIGIPFRRDLLNLLTVQPAVRVVDRTQPGLRRGDVEEDLRRYTSGPGLFL